MNERRREKRKIEEDLVIIEYFPDNASATKKKHSALTQDLSIGGARILTDKFFPVGTPFQITLTLRRTRQKVKVRGNVKWIREVSDSELYEIGVEFLHNISKTVLSLISHLYGQMQNVESVIHS
jgi:Tfp pilus assembly protein PilZ